jgi:AAA+ ATPase superfamily predicted ATPase
MYYPLEAFYPPSERDIFVDREHELGRMEFMLEEAKKGNKEDIAILGLRRIGKTILIKEFMRRNHTKCIPVYINVQRIMGEPRDFSLHFILATLFWAYHRDSEEKYLTRTSLLNQKLYNPGLYPLMEDIFNEYEKRSVDYQTFIEYCFLLLRRISELENKPVLVFLDEFQDIMLLNRFKAMGNVLAILREHLKDENMIFCISGSAVRMMENILNNADSPLFAQFSKIYVRYLDKESSNELVRKIDDFDHSVVEAIYRYTYGHPEYIRHVSFGLKEKTVLLDVKPSRMLLQEVLMEDVLGVGGRINDLCNYIYTTSLERARYKAPLKSVLRILADEPFLTQSRIAEMLGKSQGETRNYLSALEEIDLVANEDGEYFIVDPLLGLWIIGKEFGIERLTFSRSVTKRYLKHLEEKYLKARTELGVAKEYEFKYKMEKKFDIVLNNYNKHDIEFDLIGKKDNIMYIFEIKWRNRATGYKEVEKFMKKVELSEFSSCDKKLFLISRGGFTKSVEKLASEGKIELLKA